MLIAKSTDFGEKKKKANGFWGPGLDLFEVVIVQSMCVCVCAHAIVSFVSCEMNQYY